MVNIFCTRKLEAFAGDLSQAQEKTHDKNNWNGHLLSIGGKKCLFFIQKKTLYAFLIPVILKKDLKNLDQLFFDAFLFQLKSDKLYQPGLDSYLEKNFRSVKLFQTDNDQKTMGTMRDNIMHMKAFCEDKNDKIRAAIYFSLKTLNEIPVGTRAYKSPRDLMRNDLQNLI